MATKKKNDDGTSKKSGPATLEDKVRKLAGDETTEAIKAMGKEELEERLVSLAKHEKESEDDLESNDEIQQMREKVKLEKHDLKEMEAPYKDVIKSIRVQRHFIAQTLAERGQ